MWPFPRSRAPLEEPSSLSTAQYLCRLMEEQNSLLRELIQAQGIIPQTRRTGVPRAAPGRLYTDKDVSHATREGILEEDLKRRMAQAPWRTPESGPDSAPRIPSPPSDLGLPSETLPIPRGPSPGTNTAPTGRGPRS